MNLLWVTRSRFESERRHIKLLQVMLKEYSEELKEQRQEAIGLLATSQDRVDGLVKTIVTMKREGFEPTPEMIDLEQPDKLPDKIWQAIMEVSVKDTRDYFTNMAHAREALENDESHEKIIRQITYGREVDL